MDIIKRLRIKSPMGVDEGVLVDDSGVTYPLFRDALLSVKFFPVMLENGYVLTELPCTFEKNGVSIDDLPIEDYTPDGITTTEMYNNIGTRVPMDTLKQHLRPKKTMLAMPPADYTITTREEFLKYLDGVANYTLPEDFLPINYFVAPAARFNLDEYLSTSTARYRHIMENRRKMTLHKFDKLFNWLKKFGLTDSASTMDVLDAYFAWGIDGLSIEYINRTRRSTKFRLTVNPNHRNEFPVTTSTVGFIDGRGSILPPLNKRDIIWNLPTKDPSYLQSVTSGMDIDQTIVTKLTCNAEEDLTTLAAVGVDFTYSDRIITYGRQHMATITIIDPADSNRTMPLSSMLPSRRGELNTELTLRAMAKYIADNRVLNYDSSSYKVLQCAGLTPTKAIEYIALQAGLTNTERRDSDDSGDLNIVVTEDIITKYFNGEDIDPEAAAYIEQVIEGSINIDDIASAKEMQSRINAQSIYEELYAVHYVFDISLEDMYRQIVEGVNSNEICFTNGTLKHSISMAKVDLVRKAALRDLRNYDIASANRCRLITYVTQIAREVGPDNDRRHVGFEMLIANVRACEGVLSNLRKEVTELVEMNVIDAKRREELMRFINTIVYRQLFEIVLNGTVSYPAELQKAKRNATAYEAQFCRKYVDTRIESNPAYCSVNFETVTNGFSTTCYCVNAYITPYYVIPKQGFNIHESAFWALWKNLHDSNPSMYARMISEGVIPQGFQAWTLRYMQGALKQRDVDEQDMNDSLLKYNADSVSYVNNYPKSKTFLPFLNPIERDYPLLVAPDDLDDYSDIMEWYLSTAEECAPREGAPVVRLGVHGTRTFNDYKDIITPQLIDVSDPDQFLRPFRGYTAEAFIFCPDLLAKHPDESKKRVMIYGYSDTIYLPEENRQIDFRRINELLNDYAVVNTYGRNYLILAQDGQLWEARV